MERIAILGSTGSIGQNTLAVIRNLSGKFRAAGLSVNSNIGVLYKQIKEFHPDIVCVKDRLAAERLRLKLRSGRVKLVSGEAGLLEMARDKRIDKIVMAISGTAALGVLLEAIDSGKDIALANKEALVTAGSLVMKMARRKHVNILPIDSEQSAIWQCLKGEDKKKIKNIYLTASGGPFRLMPKKDFKRIKVCDALKHPRWKMGPKISVDSADLMNKGLEMLEAMYLFDVEPARIKVLIHPQSIIHSMVEFEDGVVMAQLSVTDMRVPIQYALTYPERVCGDLAAIDFSRTNRLDFEEPDFGKFPCLGLAYRAAEAKGTMPAVLNAANEVGVCEFLRKRIDFISIPRVIERVMDKHNNVAVAGLNDILEADIWARQEANNFIQRLG
jgi:1-deoxy-D-xylulose-5-phosphate reductoisomerase